MGNLNFDATNVAPSTAFDPLPNGWYTMRIVGAEMAPSEKAGEMLKLQLEVNETVHPQFANRKVFSNLCLNHPTSQQAREIAQRTLSAICHAIGKLQVSDTEMLLGQSLQVKVKATPARVDQATGKSYDAGNEVSGYKPLSENTPEHAGASASTGTATAAPAAAAAKPSWKK